MKKLILLMVFFGMAQLARGEVSTRVCLANGNMPLELADPCIPFVYRDIMVGTKLTIIVHSDLGGYWDGGGLYIVDPYRDYGVLSGRDYNNITLDWEGSRFEAAGGQARVFDWEDDFMSGFDFYGDELAEAGDWFIIDYNATQIGDCNVAFYDYTVSPFDPIYCLSFSHVRTRDFNKSTKVDFGDFTMFASHWRETGCVGPNWCEGADLDTSSTVDINDLMLFTNYWLERTK